jgi:hypothetical protein
MDKSPDSPQTNSSQEELLRRLEVLIPHSTESSVTTLELHFNPQDTEKLIITVLRFPDGTVGQVRFDYRAGTDSKLIDYDIRSNLMEAYNMSPTAKPEDLIQAPQDVQQMAAWLCSLIERSSTKKL